LRGAVTVREDAGEKGGIAHPAGTEEKGREKVPGGGKKEKGSITWVSRLVSGGEAGGSAKAREKKKGGGAGSRDATCPPEESSCAEYEKNAGQEEA